MTILSSLEPLAAELYVLKVDTVEAAVQGILTFIPSSMTGYRARLTPPDGSPLTWHIPDCAPLLKVGTASFVFPRAIKDHIFYIISLPTLSRQQLRRLELALDDFCSIFHAKEEDLTADEWAQQLQILSNSAQYNSRIARGISNASVHLANNLSEWKGQLLTRLSTQQAAAKQRLTSEQVVVDSDAKHMAEQIAAVSSATLQAVEEALTLIVKPVKAGVRLGIEHGREAMGTIKAQQEPQPSSSWGPPPPPSAAQEVFGALKSAVGTVVGAAVTNGKAVAARGTDALQDVVAHRYGADVASVSHEGLRAVVTVIQTVAAVKTFGAVNLARHTVEETAKGLVTERLMDGTSDAAIPHLEVQLTCLPISQSECRLVSVALVLDSRIVAVRLGLAVPLIPALVTGQTSSERAPPAPRIKVAITPLRGWGPGDSGYRPPPPRRLPSFTQVVADWSKELTEALPGGSPTGWSPPSSRSLSRCNSGVSEEPTGSRGLPPARGLRWLLDVVKHGVDAGRPDVPLRTVSTQDTVTNQAQSSVQRSGSTSQPRRRGSVLDDCDAWLDHLHNDSAAAP